MGDQGQPAKGATAVVHNRAALFDRGDFEDLWRELFVSEFDPTAADVLRADDVKPYTDPDLTLWTLVSAAVTVDGSGVWINAVEAEPGVQLWSPRVYLRDAGHWNSGPALPFPFSPGQLAAFMLAGPGWWLGEAFGGLGQSAPDLSRLPVHRDMPSAAQRTKRLLMLAWTAYHSAMQAVGPRPVDSADATRRCDDADRNKKVAAEHEWLGAMCQLLWHVGGRPHSQKRWTPEVLAALAEYQVQHGATAAAAHYGVSVTIVNNQLRKHRATLQAASEPTAHNPFPGRKGLR